MEKLKLHTPDFTDANIEKLAKLFPNCVTESRDDKGEPKRAIDFDALRQELSKVIVEGPQERYQLNWPGKREALITANAPIAKTLRPCLDESVDFDTTKNLFIEGDNLEALKLLQETYLGKVKMIYIDPPYNTGNDFIYEDDFAENSEDFKYRSKQTDEQGNRLVANVESNGRFHSDWLSMICSRLKLAKNLLREDGVIFISIDDNEQANLKKICNEIFGEDNYLQQSVWKRHSGGGNDSRFFAVDHEYVMCFAKNKVELCRLRLPLSDSDKDAYKQKDEHYEKLGPYKTKSFRRMRPDDPRPTLEYDIEAPDGQTLRDTWKWERARFLDAYKENKVLIRKDRNDKWQVEYKIYLYDLVDDVEQTEKTKVPRSLLLEIERNAEGKKQLRTLLTKDNIFNNPKPVGLISHLLSFGAPNENDIILDFFAGSATTAHAVMQLNAKDGGNRKFIMVQLPEPCDEKSEAFKAGFKTIAEISKERIRRAGKKIKEENATTAPNLDIGFRVLKIDTSNMKDVYYAPDSVKQAELPGQVDNVRDDRTVEDLLFQVMLDWGLDLAYPITEEKIVEKKVFFVAGNSLAACFDRGITEAFVKELAQRKPLRVVFRDTGYGSDSAKINVEQIFKLISPGTEVKAI